MSPYSVGFMIKAIILMAGGVYFFIRYYRQGQPFWISIILISTGFFDLRFLLETWIREYPVSDTVRAVVQISIHLMFVFANTLYHYLVLVFYLESVGRMKRFMYSLLLIPVLITLLLSVQYFPELKFNYTLTAVWGAIYWMVSFTLFLYGVTRSHNRDKVIYQSTIALILLTNGLILILAHFNNQEFIEMVNMTLFSIFLAICLLLLVWVNMKKMLVGLQREAVVQKMDMGTALLHHTFKNAIGKVKINAWNIRKSLSRQNYAEIDGYVQNLLSTYEHMMGMMTRFSQIMRDKPIITLEQVDLKKLLDEVADTVRSNPNVNVVKDYESITVSVDKGLVLECLVNIIHNAVEAMHGKGTITIQAKRKKRHYVVSVTDTGTGMTKEQLGQVFEPFYSTKGKTGKNMGLGLYHVRQVMDAHRGKVFVQSEPGHGTTVTLQFRKRGDEHG